MNKKFDSTKKNIYDILYMYKINKENNEKFIFDFDDIWKWLKFSRKDNAKRLLIDKFQENEDFIYENSENLIFLRSEENSESSKRGRPEKKI